MSIRTKEARNAQEAYDLHLPSYFHFGNRILEVRESRYTGDLEKELWDKHGIPLIVIDEASEDAENAVSEWKAEHSGYEIYHFEDEGTMYVYGFHRPLTESEKQDIKEMIIDCDTLPAWDVTEYSSSGDVITSKEAFHAPDHASLLHSFECAAVKPFQTGRTIEDAIDRDKHRKRLDEVITWAQKEFNDEQIRQSSE